MVVVVLMLALTTACAGAWGMLLALVGRSTFPRRERLPLRTWRWTDVRSNAARGVSMLSMVDAAAHGVAGD